MVHWNERCWKIEHCQPGGCGIERQGDSHVFARWRQHSTWSLQGSRLLHRGSSRKYSSCWRGLQADGRQRRRRLGGSDLALRFRSKWCPRTSGDLAPFFEVYVKASLETCESRDPKGLYRLAREGKIKNFTGIDDPYEEPVTPDLILDSNQKAVPELANETLLWVESKLRLGGMNADGSWHGG